MKKLLLCLLGATVCLSLVAQVKPPDTARGVFWEWYNIQQANRDLNFVGIGPWRVNGHGSTPALFEAQIRQPFLLLKGRDNQRPIYRSLALSFNLGLNLRMYQGDDNPSYPVRPLNFMTPGLVLDYFLNHTKTWRGYALEDSTRIRNFFNFQIAVSHYSNGQSGSFYNHDSTSTNKIDGNFSTNFVRPQVSWSRYLKDSSLVTTALGWTHDFGIGDIVGIEEGLMNSYGFDKLHLTLQLRTRNLPLWAYKYRQAYYTKQRDDTSKFVTQTRRVGRYTRYASFLFRTEAGLILDNVENYPTFKNKAKDKLRGSMKFTVGYYPANMRTLGLFAMLYYGRDYYNIRYTDKLLNFKTGFLFDINRYEPKRTIYVDGRLRTPDNNSD
jgi:hypothetical protein